MHHHQCHKVHLACKQPIREPTYQYNRMCTHPQRTIRMATIIEIHARDTSLIGSRDAQQRALPLTTQFLCSAQASINQHDTALTYSIPLTYSILAAPADATYASGSTISLFCSGNHQLNTALTITSSNTKVDDGNSTACASKKRRKIGSNHISLYPQQQAFITLPHQSYQHNLVRSKGKEKGNT